MIFFLNGQFVPEEQAVVSVLDRGFLYGDGLFETLPIYNGKPFRWEQHWERLRCGAEFLRIQIPYAIEAMREFAAELAIRNEMPRSLLRLTLSRGVGPRGYSPRGAERPAVVMSLHPWTAEDPKNLPRWRLVTSSFRLPANEPLAQFKTCNKVAQILARAQADAAGADEALLQNTDGCVVEGSSSNLFWVDRGTVCSPPLACGILPGVTRSVVLELCRSLSITTRQTTIDPEGLRNADAVFLSLSSMGIVAGQSLDQQPLRESSLVGPLHSAYRELLHAETSVR